MRQEVGVLEKSFSASVRVDARDLAVTGRWMREAGVGQPTRSGVLGFALRTLADSIIDREPERTITSIQEAFKELVELDMAPRSARDMMKIAQAMKMESMAWDGNKGDLSKSLRNYVAGTGKANIEAQQAVSREMDILMEDRTMNDEIQALGLSKEQAEVVRDMAKKMRDQGASREDINEKIQWFTNIRKQVAEVEQVETTERQQQTKQKYAESLYADSLDANSSTFMEDYKKRDEEKIRELKQGLSKLPETVKKVDREQGFKNFTSGTVPILEQFWDTELQDRHMEANKKRYMEYWRPEATEEDYEEWLAPLLELARPKIDSRAEDLRKQYEHQEREKKARREARAAAELK